MTKREFLHPGKEIAKEPLHYTMCGLDDIYLLNGFERKSTPHGDGVTISHMDDLHKRIGLALVRERKTLKPKELRFLRKEMGMTQEQLGSALQLSGQQVARWEKGAREKGGCEISGPAEMLLRIVYVASLVPANKRSAVLGELLGKLRQLSKADEAMSNRMVFKETPSGWTNWAAYQTRELAMAH